MKKNNKKQNEFNELFDSIEIAVMNLEALRDRLLFCYSEKSQDMAKGVDLAISEINNALYGE